MQRIISWMLFDEWLYKNPSFDPNIGERRILQEEFRAWVRMCVRHGIDGDIVLGMLEDRGIPLSAEFTHFAQQLRGNELGPLMDAGSTPKVSLVYISVSLCDRQSSHTRNKIAASTGTQTAIIYLLRAFATNSCLLTVLDVLSHLIFAY